MLGRQVGLPFNISVPIPHNIVKLWFKYTQLLTVWKGPQTTKICQKTTQLAGKG